MTRDINAKYLGKIDKSFEDVTCVSCHRGSTKPMVSVDSLPKREMPPPIAPPGAPPIAPPAAPSK